MSTDKTNAKLARLREQIAAKKRDLADLDYVKVPREEAARSLDASIEMYAARGSLSAASFAEGRGLSGYTDSISAFNLLCWIAPDLVRKRFSDELDRLYEGAVAMDAHAVDQKRATLERELFELEVAEERLIVQAEEAGQRINRRGDADPRAVLEA
ncbi:hypothetical protein LK996_15620 [Lysobacter sp. A6]|uniref:Uncharacterized protein n=1 Tax=Noviluteimonas lactosilytica TaxID=2888523 RepID=A0ABS8JLZ2_9GAMM|nr:hypothetical protein [Lysobacter lactosilyticus]MCC8364500.1 hypothetical protein [Lysobacter lactosilyticus]